MKIFVTSVLSAYHIKLITSTTIHKVYTLASNYQKLKGLKIHRLGSHSISVVETFQCCTYKAQNRPIYQYTACHISSII